MPCGWWIVFQLSASLNETKRFKPFATRLLLSWQMFGRIAIQFRPSQLGLARPRDRGYSSSFSSYSISDEEVPRRMFLPRNVYRIVKEVWERDSAVITILTTSSRASTIIYLTYIFGCHKKFEESREEMGDDENFRKEKEIRMSDLVGRISLLRGWKT